DADVYHCDLKPENVLVDIDRRNPRIADFGLPRLPTSTGSVSYMAPTATPGSWALCINLVNLVSAMYLWNTPQRPHMRWKAFAADPDFFCPTIPRS
ncbi:hypothetical protein C8R46DRAFT_852857, partial [Mycena filopes]